MTGVEPAAPLVAEVGMHEVGELHTSIASKISSSKNLDDNYNILVKHMEMLLAIQKDTEWEVQRNNHKDTTNAYKLWTNRVSVAVEEVQKLKIKYEEKILPWWRIQRRSRLSEEMEKQYECVRELMKDECLIRDFLVDKPPEPVLKELNVPQISEYPTLQDALEDILCLLKNNKIKVIGVCGTKGVGKTTVMRNLNNNEEVAKLFEIVIFVKVTADDHKLQEKIANRLMLDINTTKEHSDTDDVARRIHKELETKKYLLILDEVEGAIDLEQLGIPSDNNGSKVVIATRFPFVYKLNRVQRVVNVMKQMDFSLSKEHGSLKNATMETSSEKYEISYKELSRLTRIREFISLLLTYPMKIEEEGILKSWICAFPEWKAQLLSTDYDTVIDIPWLELTDKAFRRIKGFVPMEIIRQIERGQTSIFNHYDAIPEAINHLAVDLAVNQLIQTMFSRDYSAACYIRLLTRNLIEKRAVVNKIVSALEEKHGMFGFDKHFLRALWINASTYESDVEVQVQEDINTMMVGSSVTEDHDIERKMGSNMHLVIVVDTDSNKKLDLQKVHFPTGTVLLITTEPSTQAQKDDEFIITCKTDLNIRTQDHLLPWKVFCSNVGSRMVHSSMVIQRIAVQIVKECHGHLLTIVLVAKYLKCLKYVEDVKQWELALDKLSSLNPSYDYQHSDRIGISRVMVNAFVNIIWEDIDDTQKLCLELSLFVHNIKIGVPEVILVSDWTSTLFGYAPEMTLNLDEFGEYRGQVQYCIRELLDRFILLKWRVGEVYLPEETYDIIKTLHSWNPSIIRHGYLGLIEAPYIGRWHGLIQIELMDNKICELPQSPDCPKLKVLLLQGNIDLMDIPDSFFNHMPLLQHLDLSSTSIRDLPPSVSKLIQLKKFYLRGCDLFMELPPQIGQLKNLEELDLDGTMITHLPKEIGELTNLQSLTLCFDGYQCHHGLGHGKKGKQISNSTIIPPGVISNLTRLNYLSINVEPEDERWNEHVNNVLVEIFGLEGLEKVIIFVPKAELLELIPAQKSFNFRLVVGHHLRRFISRVTPEVEQEFKRCDNSLKFVNGVDVPNGVKMNLEHFKALYLDRHMTIKSLSEFEVKNLRSLQVCILAECNEMETIVDASYLHDGNAIPNLEFLSVFYMKNLRSICGIPSYPSFCRLKSIALHTCPMLTTVFTLLSLNNLSLLEEIIVEDCPKVTTLISHDSPQQRTPLFLPKLRMISLLYLPELVNIFNGLRVEQDLEELTFYYCPKLQSLSKSELSSKSLRIIKGESMWWEALKWNEWGDTGRPNFFEQTFSPINEEADIMTQLAAYQKTQLNEYHDYKPLGKSYLETHALSSLSKSEAPVSLLGSSKSEAQKPNVVTKQKEVQVVSKTKETKKIVLKVDLKDNQIEKRVMKKVSSLSGCTSVSLDMKEQKLTVTGDVDPVAVVKKLRKLCHVEIVSVGPAKEEKGLAAKEEKGLAAKAELKISKEVSLFENYLLKGGHF